MDTVNWILKNGSFLDPYVTKGGDFPAGIVQAATGASWSFHWQLEIQQAGETASLMSPEMDAILTEFFERTIQQPIRRHAAEGIDDIENWLNNY